MHSLYWQLYFGLSPMEEVTYFPIPSLNGPSVEVVLICLLLFYMHYMLSPQASDQTLPFCIPNPVHFLLQALFVFHPT